jgi:cell wall-associated NlpC family hydrolase
MRWPKMADDGRTMAAMNANARGDGARRLLQGLAAGLLVSALLSVLVVFAAMPAAAAPDGPGAAPPPVRARAQALLDRLDQLTKQGETVAEDFNAATEELRRLESQVRTLRQSVAGANERLAAAREVLNQRARATYKYGGGDEFLGMLVFPELAPSTERFLTELLERDAEAVEAASAARTQIAATERDLTAAIAHQQVVMGELGRQRAELGALTTRIIAEMRAADPKLRAAIAALLRESEARALADWAAFGGDAALSPAARALTAVRVALAQVGDPYVYGATGPDTFDCSGLMVYSYRAAGVSLPRVSRDQYRLGSKVPLTALLPGDLVFWAHNTADPATVHHVAMYVGSGRVVHAPHPGARVRVAAIWRQGLIGAVRPAPGSLYGPPAPQIKLPPNPPDWPIAPPSQPPPVPPAPVPAPTSPRPTSPPPTVPPSSSPAPSPPPTSPPPTPTPTDTPTVMLSGTPTTTTSEAGTPTPTEPPTP